MKVYTIINVGHFDFATGAIGILPFYLLTFPGGKRIFVNYTFGTMKNPKIKKITYETKAGELKEELFRKLNPEGFDSPTFIDGTPEAITDVIKDLFRISDDGEKILIVYPRDSGDDRPFYAALGFSTDPKTYQMAPISLSDVGYTVDSPFREVPIGLLKDAEVIQTRDHFRKKR